VISLRETFARLHQRYGPLGWWPGDGPFEVIVGAILTQGTAWANVQKALANLKAAGALDPVALRALTEAELAALVRPSGFFRAKSRKLKAFLGLLDERFGGDLGRLLAAPGEELRPLLLATHGIGPETADAILLYAARRPRFVIDAYTRRTFSRIGRRPERDSYDAWQRLFEESLPRDVDFYGEYHALIVEHAKDVCRAEPRCGECVLVRVCAVGLRRHHVTGDDGVVQHAAGDDQQVEDLVVAEDARERVRPA
jgi:endonuclease-3 related protein